ncbi:MAG: efflux RND transporter periplasmic adaptor subunit [Chloroflexota bacterium]|nr:efflux RND transporter periplasmic adaptor subunit [Chloroflexota bacterium]
MTAINLDEDLTINESAWRGRIITVAIVLAIAAAIAVGVYVYQSRGSTTVARATEDVPVKRATINQTLIISGTADAAFNSNLIFQSSGKVAFVSVATGQPVKQGDVLASLESDDLANAVASARANQQAAQLKLDNLLAGSTAAELASADQAVAVAEATLVKAKNDYQDLLNGPKAADLAAAQTAVQAAQAQLATATSTKQKLDDLPSDADVAAAEAGVAAAEAARTAAQNTATNAENSVLSSAAALKGSESSYCVIDPSPLFCAARVAPVSAEDLTIVNEALTTAANVILAGGVISANTAYMNTVNLASSANSAVTSAQNAVDSAREKLDLVNQGPSSEETAAANAAVVSAQAALASANAKLADVQQGGTDSQKADALAAADSAEATLASAEAKRAEAVRGPDANALDQARQAVRTAALTVEAGQIRLKNAQIVAPFDGTVAAVNAKPGEFFGATTTTPAIVLLTPDAITLKMTVGETDYPNLKKDQGGVVLFDGIPGKPYPFKITEIGLNPTTSSGVVTYDVKGSIVILPGNPKPAPGMSARGQITTDSKPDVLVIPPRAIRRKGTDQVVDVRHADGTVDEAKVVTGVSDTENVEIISGLSEGDSVIVATLVSAAKSQPTPKPTLPGGVR